MKNEEKQSGSGEKTAGQVGVWSVTRTLTMGPSGNEVRLHNWSRVVSQPAIYICLLHLHTFLSPSLKAMQEEGKTKT